MTPIKTFEKIQQENKEKKISRSLVFKWHKCFSVGRENVKDDKRCGWNTINARLIDDHKTCLDTDRRQTIEEIMETTDCSYGTLCRILHNHLRMSRVSARWVPRILTGEKLTRRVRDSMAFPGRIITCDETWFLNRSNRSQCGKLQTHPAQEDSREPLWGEDNGAHVCWQVRNLYVSRN